MPTVSVGRDRLFKALGKTYSQEDFDQLCFEFGIELDDVTTEKAIIRKEKHLDDEDCDEDEEIIYKIEVPANRYDLLCLEGIVQSLRIFIGKDEIPTYKLADISPETMLKMHVKPETSSIRPYVVCAVLRGVTFDEASYNSFIDLQDKLHQNICRRRTLVAIGTHDLDTVQGPFTYEALPPSEINFMPLKQVKTFRSDELMEFYKSDLKLKKFLHIIENSPVFPVILDRNRTVLSLPPIINGAHSAINLKTKNVFIECTATDLNKAMIVLNIMVTTFSVYCQKKFEVEPVEVVYSDGKSYVCPDLSVYEMEVPLSYTGESGVSLDSTTAIALLNKMQLGAKESVAKDGQNSITVSVPPTRSDVLHPCDVMEDVAIAYGYNEIPKTTFASLRSLPLNQLTDAIIDEMAMIGFSEQKTFTLCSYKEIFDMLNRKDDKSTAVIISNPRSSDFQAVRTTLMPGLLKVVAYNMDHSKPMKLFDVGDINLLCDDSENGARNLRSLAGLYCGATNSGFEIIHGVVDRIMEVMDTSFVPRGDDTGYYIKCSDEPEYLPGRQASIIYKGKRIGAFGIVHPEVLNNFDIPYPCSYFELCIESFL